MNTAKKIYESDAEGVVHLDVPVGAPGRRVEVLVVWTEAEESLAHEGQGRVPPEEDWSDLFGLLKEDPLERPSPGEYETREPLL